MKERGLPSESAAARFLFEREQGDPEAVLRMVAELRDLGKRYRGPRVRASEDVDEFLGRLRE